MNAKLKIQSVDASSPVTVMLDRVPQHTKPKSAAKISNRLINSTATLSVEALAHHLAVDGFSFCCAVFEGARKNEHWKQQQVFGIDIDKGLNPDEFLERCDVLDLHPCFVYSTFSDSSSLRKYRAIFVMEEVITDANTRDLVTRMFLEIFPEADRSCSDAVRIFFGGRELLYTNFCCRVPEEQLRDSFLARLRVEHSKNRNFSRKVKALRSKYSVFLPSVDEKTSGIDAFNGNPIYIGLPSNSSILDTFSDSPPAGPEALTHCSTQRKYKYRLGDAAKQQLLRKCQLLADLDAAGQPVRHQHLFLIASNLFKFFGGQAWFFQMLKKLITNGHEHPDKVHSFNASIPSLNRHQHAQTCEHGGCPYFSTCERSGITIKDQLSIRQGEIRRVKEQPLLRSVEETRKLLREALTQAYSPDATRITVIKVDSGIGKTEALLELPLENTFIAFPTHRLKEEAYERFIAKQKHGFKWVQRPALPEPFEARAQRCEDLKISGVKHLVEGALAVSEDAEFIRSSTQYLQSIETIHHETVIFGTHEKAFSFDGTGINTVIIDEDILRSMVKITSIAQRDLARLLAALKNDPEFQDVFAYLRPVYDAPPAKPHKNTCPIPKEKWHRFIHKYQNAMNTPVTDLREAEAFTKDDEGHVLAVRKESLLKDKKYIILSATASEEIYRGILGEELEFIDLSGVETLGNLYLHPRRSFSRSSIEQNTKRFINTVRSAVNTYGLDGIITFKKYEDAVRAEEIPVYTHFGATEGLDAFKGKNIGVFGTPFPSPHVCTLIGYLITSDDGIYEKCEFRYRVIERHEFQAKMQTCSDDALLQEIQLWLIESELIQAVGRARLVNHECQVHVFASYPLAGGNLV